MSAHGSDPSSAVSMAPDMEKAALDAGEKRAMAGTTDVEVAESEALPLGSGIGGDGLLGRVWRYLVSSGVETRGVEPVPEALRTDTGFNKVFTVWFTSLMCPLPIVTGMLAPLAYGLKLRDASLLILFFSLLLCLPPAIIETMSPRTGMRQMVQSRFAFGMYPNILIVILNMASICGYSIISLVTAGQTLAAVSGDSINATCGIVIVAVCSMVPAFAGFGFIHQYQRYAWVPAVIAIIITIGCGGNKLHLQTPASELGTPSAQTVISFISLIAGYFMPYCTTVGDIAVYMPRNAPKWRIMVYCWMGLTLPTVLLMIVGAAIGGAVPQVPAWAAANDADSTGGVLVAMLSPAGGFGKFVAVLLALSVVSQVAPGFYSISLNFQIMWPGFAKVPRLAFVVAITAIDIGVGIKAASSFYDSLSNFLGVVSYWSPGFAAVLLLEWYVFRGGNPDNFITAHWNDARKLPTGIPALLAVVVPFGLIVPCMAQVWYTGPIAVHSGDLGFEASMVLGVLLYLPLRKLEIKLLGRV